jgi:hypothetical protein
MQSGIVNQSHQAQATLQLYQHDENYHRLEKRTQRKRDTDSPQRMIEPKAIECIVPKITANARVKAKQSMRTLMHVRNNNNAMHSSYYFSGAALTVDI